MAAFDDIDLSMDELDDDGTMNNEADIEGDLEKYGVWVKTGPEDIDESENEADNEFELEDLGLEESFEQNESLTEEEEELLSSLEAEESLPDLSEDLEMTKDQEFDEDFSFDEITETSLPTAEEENSIIDESSFDIPDSSVELPELDTDDGIEPDEEPGDTSDDFSDIDALEADLTNVEEDFTDSISSLKEAAGEKDLESESSRSILLKIEEELLSIKNELSDLKSELSTIKTSDTHGSEASQAEDVPGFFEDDEDETIALTGDELDNILNTADITEKSGTESEAPEDESLKNILSPPENDFPDLDLDEAEPEEPFASEEITDSDVEALLNDNLVDSETFSQEDTEELLNGFNADEASDEIDLDNIGLETEIEDKQARETSDIEDDFSLDLDDEPLPAEAESEEGISMDLDEALLTSEFTTEETLIDETESLEAENESVVIEDEPFTETESTPDDEISLDIEEESSDLGFDLGDISSLDEEPELENETSEEEISDLDGEPALDEEISLDIEEEPSDMDFDLEDIPPLDEESVPDEIIGLDLADEPEIEEAVSDEEIELEDISLDDDSALDEDFTDDEIELVDISLDDDSALDEEISLDLEDEDTSDDEIELVDIPLDDDSAFDEEISLDLEEEDTSDEEIDLEDISLDDDSVLEEEISLDLEEEDTSDEEIDLEDISLDDDSAFDEEISLDLEEEDTSDEEIDLEDISLDEEIDLSTLPDLDDKPLPEDVSENILSLAEEDAVFEELPDLEDSASEIVENLSASEDLDISEVIDDNTDIEEEVEDSEITFEDEDNFNLNDEIELNGESLELLNEEPAAVVPEQKTDSDEDALSTLPDDLKTEIKSVLTYMDQLLESLPDDKIEEFAKSEHFDVYKKLFDELGLKA